MRASSRCITSTLNLKTKCVCLMSPRPKKWNNSWVYKVDIHFVPWKLSNILFPLFSGSRNRHGGRNSSRSHAFRHLSSPLCFRFRPRKNMEKRQWLLQGKKKQMTLTRLTRFVLGAWNWWFSRPWQTNKKKLGSTMKPSWHPTISIGSTHKSLLIGGLIQTIETHYCNQCIIPNRLENRNV